MKFKPGDQVSFVNEKGGGTVISVTKNGSYKVALEDGFDLTVSEKDLALVKSAALEEKKTEPVASNQPDAMKDKIFKTPENEITFIIVPANENNVLTGEVAFYLSNHTVHELYFVLSYCKDKQYFLIDHARMASGEELHTGQFIRQDLTDWSNLHIQVLLFQKNPYHFLLPVHMDIPVLLPDLSFHSQEKGRFGFARQFSVYRYFAEEEFAADELIEKFSKTMPKNLTAKKPPVKKHHDDTFLESRYGIYRNQKEVDLHIDVLISDKHELTNTEMLALQLQRFRKEMDHALMNHFHSITFIHGIGEGVLRKALTDELRHYPGVTWRNGAYEKYGAGAIEIILV